MHTTSLSGETDESRGSREKGKRKERTRRLKDLLMEAHHLASTKLFLFFVLFFCRELREKIQPEIMELIKQQRLNRLCEGTCFRKISSRRRQGESQAGHP